MKIDMKMKIYIAIGLLLVIILAGGYFYYFQPEDLGEKEQKAKIQEREIEIEKLLEISDIDPDLREIIESAKIQERKPSSLDKIQQALDAGEISIDQALKYKVQAVFYHESLPDNLMAEPAKGLEGDMVLYEINENWERLSDETKKALEPFFLPPEDPGSFFNLNNQDKRREILNNL